MTNRVDELWGDALDQTVPETWTTLNPAQLAKLKQKFAELIVRECMEQVWYTREDGINGNISEIIKARMTTHFGVEQ